MLARRARLLVVAGGSGDLFQLEVGRGAGVGLEDSVHAAEGMVALIRVDGRNAVRGYDELEVAHVCVVGREQDAQISADAGEYESARAEIVQQGVKRRGEEGRVLRLDDKVVLFVGSQELDDRAAAYG